MRGVLRTLAFVGALGILWAQAGKEDAFIGARGRYWAFQKLVPTPVPGAGHPIDAFILDGLKGKQLTPSGPLDREQLIRRVTFDLTGLPPTPGEVDAFLRDKSPAAYEKVVDRLIASPHYGERWACKWLDVVRYADTNGFELDCERPHAWRYRDYVVHVVQHRQAVRPLHPGADRGRRAVSRRQGSAHRDRVPARGPRASGVAAIWIPKSSRQEVAGRNARPRRVRRFSG